MNGQKPATLIGTMPYDIDPEELNCSVCLDIFEYPVELPCKHKLCLQCWNKILKNDSKCPECRSKVQDPSFVFVNEVLWNHIKVNHREELLERKKDLTSLMQTKELPKRDLVAEIATLSGPSGENRQKAAQEKNDELLAWKLQKREQSKEDRQRAKQVRLDRKLAESIAREEEIRAKGDGTHWKGNMQLWAGQESSDDSDSSIEVVSESCSIRAGTSQESVLSHVRQSPRTISVTSGTAGATLQFKAFSNQSTASHSRFLDRRYVWNPIVSDNSGNSVSDQSIERGQRKRKHELVGVSLNPSLSGGSRSRYHVASSTVTSGAYEREMQGEVPQD